MAETDDLADAVRRLVEDREDLNDDEKGLLVLYAEMVSEKARERREKNRPTGSPVR